MGILDGEAKEPVAKVKSKSKGKAAPQAKVEETDVPSVAKILTKPVEEKVIPPDVTAAVGGGIAVEVVVPPKTEPEIARAKRVEDYPLVKIVCLEDITPSPSYNRWRFPDSFAFRKQAQAMIPQPVATFLSEKGVVAIIK